MVVAVKILRLILEGGSVGDMLSAFGGSLAGVSWQWVRHRPSRLGQCRPGPTMGSGVPTPKGA